MRSRRHHADAGSQPSGRAEVELFTFWEQDATGEHPAPVVPSESELSTSPLWCAAALALLFVLVALLL
jgi:hypothetical protein